MTRLKKAGRLSATGNTLTMFDTSMILLLFLMDNIWSDTGIAGFAIGQNYVVQTSAKVIERCILMTTDPGDLVA